jgi:hypothetical protein
MSKFVPLFCKNIKKHIYGEHKHQRIERPHPEGELFCRHPYNGDEQGHRGPEASR